MGLRLESEILHLPFRDPFRIARAMDEGEVATTVIVRLRDEDDPPDMPVSFGEGFPDPYYGETPETIRVVLPLLLNAAEPIVRRISADADAQTATAALAEAGDAMNRAISHNGAAKCALDTALHDRFAQRLGIPVYRLLGLSAEIPPTDFTVGIDEPAIVAERAARAKAFPALKVKVGGPADVATLEGVRAVYSGPIRVDANTAWEPEQSLRLVPELERLGVELIEQPFPAHRLDQLAWLQERSALPIVADESAVTILDLERLQGVVAGVNVKLAKCGGPGFAARMLRRAVELGFRTFLGCMEETSVGIAASAAVASLAEWVDLDGCLLLAHDPFAGLELDSSCRWVLSERPGLGVVLRAG